MTDRIELLEAALDALPEGVGLFAEDGDVAFWNQAAQDITGYSAFELIARELPDGLALLLAAGNGMDQSQPLDIPPENRRRVARVEHKMGHLVPVITNVLVLNNGLGERIGSAAVFHPAETLDALPQSEVSNAAPAEDARTDLLERLQIECDDFARGGAPIGVLRITVDQAQELRKTHGAAACHAMLEKVYHALAHGLRPGEEIGYWANDGFLVIAHERNTEMLAAHAHTLAGLARTADFRWWGDRISLTVSIGAAQLGGDNPESLTEMLQRASEAMEASIREGGNRATTAAANHGGIDAREDLPCSPS